MRDITGGLNWHLRAMIGRMKRWRPFMADVADWLDEWRPHSRKLLIIGASAGWSLPDPFLARFDEIHCIDTDPLARPLFGLLHAAIRPRLVWSQTDFFAQIGSVLSQYPDHAILFCNIAGQRCFQVKNANWVEAEFQALQSRLQFREWASYHDLLSAPCSAACAALKLEDRVGARDILQRMKLEGEWMDHLTGSFLPKHWPRKIIPWRFDARRLHLVEAGFSPTSQPS